MQAIKRDVALMEKMNEDLKIPKMAAEAANKAKSNFLATVSYEIRSSFHLVLYAMSMFLPNFS
jgi:histidine kinase 2/3/4 (cytokinin receptor)